MTNGVVTISGFDVKATGQQLFQMFQLVDTRKVK